MPFRAVLSGLVARAPFVRGAVFCDFEGERVEAVRVDPELDPYELDLVGASYARLVELLGRHEGAQLRVTHPRDVVWVQLVSEGYYVVLLARRHAADGALRGPLHDAGEALRDLL